MEKFKVDYCFENQIKKVTRSVYYYYNAGRLLL
jgi:hypothetical protein